MAACPPHCMLIGICTDAAACVVCGVAARIWRETASRARAVEHDLATTAMMTSTHKRQHAQRYMQREIDEPEVDD
jgi:hypothetical protein